MAERNALTKPYPQAKSVAHGKVGLRREFGFEELNVITNMDFGHTDPQWILPLGGRARIDPSTHSMVLLEPAVVYRPTPELTGEPGVWVSWADEGEK
jgi:LD-carboxypeptidase C-terminal domain